MSKALIEERNDLLEEMEGLVEKAKSEKRAFKNNELKRIEECKVRISEIDRESQLENRGGQEVIEVKTAETRESKELEQRKADEQAFLTFVKENRAGTMTAGANGNVIPTSIANKIIETAKNISPIFKMATIYNVSSDLILPNYDYVASNPFQYYTEGSGAITPASGNFNGVKLQSYIAANVCLVSKSLINRSDLDVVAIICGQIALSLAYFVENELINEAGGKLKGLKSGVTNVTNGATTMVIDPAELVKMQLSVPQVFQPNAVWLMHPQTFAYLRSLKDSTGRLMFEGLDVGVSDLSSFSLLGKPVLLSDNMPQMAVGAREIYYGNITEGLAIKLVNGGMEMQTLVERYADQYAIGIACYQEMDSVVANAQALAVYVGK